MLLEVMPAFISSAAPLRHAVYNVSSSTTLKSISIPISLKLCCRNSFIGSDSICPVPPCAMTKVVFSGFSFE